jgi:hypothetical protein
MVKFKPIFIPQRIESRKYFAGLKNKNILLSQWFRPIILCAQEADIKKIKV